MVTLKQKSWSRVFSVRNINDFVKKKNKCGINSFEHIGYEEIPKWQQTIKWPTDLKPRLKKPRPASRYTESRPTRICSTPGAGESHYRRINELCLETRKKMQVMVRDFSLKSNVLRTACKNCDDAVKTAIDNWQNEGISPEFLRLKLKLKEKRSKMRTRRLFKVNL